MGAKNQSISDRQESERMGKKIEGKLPTLHFKGLVGELGLTLKMVPARTWAGVRCVQYACPQRKTSFPPFLSYLPHSEWRQPPTSRLRRMAGRNVYS